jgi:hypothetical protein
MHDASRDGVVGDRRDGVWCPGRRGRIPATLRSTADTSLSRLGREVGEGSAGWLRAAGFWGLVRWSEVYVGA